MSKKNEDGKIFQKIDPWIQDDEDVAKAGPFGGDFLTRALLYVRRNRTYGKVPKRCWGEVSYGFSQSLSKKVLASFLETGLFIDCGDHYEIRKWAVKYNMAEDDEKQRSEELSKNGSLGMHNRWNHSPSNASPECDICVKKGWA